MVHADVQCMSLPAALQMVKADEHSKAFRERMENLNEYSRSNELPPVRAG
jgi:hypothetical protein